MINPSEIRERMEVIGSDGQPVGTVDKVEGNRIKLAKSNPAAQGQNHYIPLDSVCSFESAGPGACWNYKRLEKRRIFRRIILEPGIS